MYDNYIIFLKRQLYQTLSVSVLLNGCTTRKLTKGLEKKLDGNYTRLLHIILNNPKKLYSTKLYGYLPPILQNIQVRHSKETMGNL